MEKQYVPTTYRVSLVSGNLFIATRGMVQTVSKFSGLYNYRPKWSKCKPLPLDLMIAVSNHRQVDFCEKKIQYRNVMAVCFPTLK